MRLLTLVSLASGATVLGSNHKGGNVLTYAAIAQALQVRRAAESGVT